MAGKVELTDKERFFVRNGLMAAGGRHQASQIVLTLVIARLLNKDVNEVQDKFMDMNFALQKEYRHLFQINEGDTVPEYVKEKDAEANNQ